MSKFYNSELEKPILSNKVAIHFTRQVLLPKFVQSNAKVAHI